MINVEKSIKNFEKIFDDKGLPVTFDGLHKIIQKHLKNITHIKTTLKILKRLV